MSASLHPLDRRGRARRTLRSVVAALTTVGLATVITVSGGSSPASADLVPPFEPDPLSIGGLTLFNAAGTVVTGGSITDAPFASYVQASGAGRTGDTKATLFAYSPKSGVPTGSWSGEALTASTSYPNAGAPVSVTASGNPLVSVTAADETLAAFVGNYPNGATDNYQGLYQLRLKTSGPQQTAAGTYYSADILVTGTTWTLVYSNLSGSEYVPLVPARLLETRAALTTIDGLFNGTGPAPIGTVTELVVAGRGGVPANALAAALNVTVTEPGAAGFATVYPCGSDRPTASNLNFAADQTIANAVVTKIGTGGKVCIFNSQATHLVVDVNGYYPVTSVYSALVPGRLLETRSGLTTVDGQFNATGFVPIGTVTELPVTDRAGVPANAAAVVLNVTITEPAAAGFATVYPCGSDRPTASNINYAANQTIANAVVTKVGSGGKVCIFNSQPTHLVVDVNGYYPATSVYAALVPGRLLETRSGLTTVDTQFNATGFVAIGTVTELPVVGRAGVPNNGSAVVLNVTITEPAAAGFATVYPCGTDRPTASNVNFAANQTIANAVITKVGSGGKVCIFNSQPTHIVVDVNGYYP